MRSALLIPSAQPLSRSLAVIIVAGRSTTSFLSAFRKKSAIMRMFASTETIVSSVAVSKHGAFSVAPALPV